MKSIAILKRLGLENVFISPTFPEEEDAFDPFGVSQPEQPLTPETVAAFRALPEVQSVTPTLDLPYNMEISLSYAEVALPIRLSGGFGHSPAGPGMPAPPEMLAGVLVGRRRYAGIDPDRGSGRSTASKTRTWDTKIW